MRPNRMIAWMFTALPLLGLCGCDAEDTSDTPGGERVPVTIRLDVENAGPMTKGTTANVLTEESEINTLNVSITGGGDNVNLTKEDFEERDGELVAMTTLSVGRKTISAVANVGDSPASPIDAVSMITTESPYIPMSTTADTTWNVTGAGEYNVSLNRMVAKMKVSIVNDNPDETVSVTSFKISGLLPETTPLHRSAYGVVASPLATLAEWSWDTPSVGETGTVFYLHETTGTFDISLRVDGENEDRSTSFTKAIPRNHYFPLVVHITDYALEIKGSYNYAPIGVLPITGVVNPNGYEITLPEGAGDIDITVTLKRNGQPVASGVTWGYPEEGESPFTYSEEEDGTLSVTADAIPALPEQTFTLSAAYGTDEQDFEVTIKVVGLEEMTRSADAAGEGVSPIIVEL